MLCWVVGNLCDKPFSVHGTHGKRGEKTDFKGFSVSSVLSVYKNHSNSQRTALFLKINLPQPGLERR